MEVAAQARFRKRISRIVIGIFIVTYCFITIVPFYFLFVRSFVPTHKSTELWLWIPTADDPNLDAQIGSYATHYNLELARFKEEFGISGYLKPSRTLREISVEYDIEIDAMVDYFRPYANYSGWIMIATQSRYFEATLMTALIVAVSVTVGGFLSAATGSVLARFHRRFHMAVYRLYILEMIVPPAMVILPLFLIVTQVLHLRNSYLSLILFFIKGGAIPTLLFTSFIAAIPEELKDSVYVDGGNRHTWFFRILLPLIMPAFAAMFAMRIPKYWNDLLHGYVLLSPDKYTLVPMIASLAGEFDTNFQAIYSGLFLSLVPIVLLYLTFNRMFISAQLSGALKG